METINRCPICNTKAWFKYRGHIKPFVAGRTTATPPATMRCGIIKCPSCSFVCADVRFNDEEMKRLYTGYRQEQYHQERLALEPAYAKYLANVDDGDKAVRRPLMAEFLAKHAANYCQASKHFLDYGSGDGDYIPSELFPNAEMVFYDPFYNATLSGKQFDFITCCHVLEHLSYPMIQMREMVTLAAPGAIIYLEVPLEPRKWYIKLYHLLKTTGRGFHEHINNFNVKSLSRLVKESGLKMIRIETFPIALPSGSEVFIRALAQKV